jgi:ABC-type antimicrobial peptide transport system permease subunit/ABC-type multidrug transport system ATPase subunit
MPLDYSTRRPGHAAARERGHELLVRVGLSQRMDHEPSQMSGGQQQRVAIARSLINQPTLLLADEPTGNLDSHTSVEILQMFQALNAQGITVILVTHDPKVASYAHRTIRITDGLIESDGPSESVLAGPHLCGPRTVHSNGDHSSNGHSESNGHHDSGLSSSNGESNGNGHSATQVGAGGWGAPSQGVPAVTQTSAGGVATLPAKLRAQAVASPDQAVASEPEKTLEAEEKQAHHPIRALLPPTLRTALGALRRNKMRSALTTLGIVIGVGAVIAVTEIGQGVKAANQAVIATMGANNLLIMSGAAASGGVSWGSGSVLTLTPTDCDELARQCDSVTAVAPIVRANRATAIYGGRSWIPNSITGTTPEYLVVRDWQDMDEGEMFADRDVLSGNKVCVIGQTLVRELFQGRSPIGQSIRVQNVSLRVIGVLSRKGANMGGMDQDDIIIAPWTTIKYRISGNNAQATNPTGTSTNPNPSGGQPTNTVNTLNNLYPSTVALYPTPSATQQADTPQAVKFTNVDSVMAKAASTEEINPAMDQITRVLRERHHLRDDEPDDFNIRDMTEMTKMFTETSELISLLLLIVAGISLGVGGVGIMNIMLVSVTERTKEIGLRMAVGARSYHILRQFLIEAVVLCLFGGAVGIILGRGATMLVHYFKHWPTQASLPAIIAAFAVSATVGIAFGFYPAWKASRLDPIEALRYE